jgi:hypothetical protein
MQRRRRVGFNTSTAFPPNVKYVFTTTSISSLRTEEELICLNDDASKSLLQLLNTEQAE